MDPKRQGEIEAIIDTYIETKLSEKEGLALSFNKMREFPKWASIVGIPVDELKEIARTKLHAAVDKLFAPSKQ